MRVTDPCQLCSWRREKKASHQHQDALRRELEAQVHTIQILTCEKTELQTALYYSQHAVQQLEGESRDLVSCLHDSWKFAGELEQALSAVATQKKKAGRYIEELTKERDALSLELYRNTYIVGRIIDEELKEKNIKLQEKLRLLESEMSEIQLNVKELERKLERAKLLLPQASGCSPGGCGIPDRLGPWSRDRAGYGEAPVKS
ncbi:hypothetical protein H8958_015547 [Nasalis larvatus]